MCIRDRSCSTRTTHPYFIGNFNEILAGIGIKNKVINIFAYKSKREIVNNVKDNICLLYTSRCV